MGWGYGNGIVTRHYERLFSALSTPNGVQVRYLGTTTYEKRRRGNVVATQDVYHFEVRVRTFRCNGMRTACSLAVAEKALGVAAEVFTYTGWLSVVDTAGLEELFDEFAPLNFHKRPLWLLLMGALYGSKGWSKGKRMRACDGSWRPAGFRLVRA